MKTENPYMIEKPGIKWVKDGKGNLMGVGKMKDVMNEKPDSGKKGTVIKEMEGWYKRGWEDCKLKEEQRIKELEQEKENSLMSHVNDIKKLAQSVDWYKTCLERSQQREKDLHKILAEKDKEIERLKKENEGLVIHAKNLPFMYKQQARSDFVKELSSPEVLERLSEIEHEQWVHWSRAVVDTVATKKYNNKRWLKLWIPYSQLTEEMKEHDRVWARKVISALKEKEGK